MTITVEDGTGVAAANSYITQAQFEDYCEARNLDLSSYTDEQIEAAILRATDYLDATYRSRFPGVRSNGTDQGLQWPRKAGAIYGGVFYPNYYLETVTDAEGLPIAVDEIPMALKRASFEAAYRELTSPNSLAPDLKRGGDIKSLSAGSVSVTYKDSAKAGTTFTVIDGIMAGLLGPSETSGYTARAVRV